MIQVLTEVKANKVTEAYFKEAEKIIEKLKRE